MSEHEPATLVEQIAAVLGGAFTYPIKAHDGRVIGAGKGYLPAWEAEGLASQLARLVEREKHKAWDEGRYQQGAIYPPGGHYDDCAGWEDCYCGANPYARD